MQQSIGHKREFPTQIRKLIVQQLTCLSKELDRRLPWGIIKTMAF